jgi:hypothetical protein
MPWEMSSMLKGAREFVRESLMPRKKSRGMTRSWVCPAFATQQTAVPPTSAVPLLLGIHRKIFVFDISLNCILRLGDLQKVSTMQDLPADCLYLICEELANKKDFGTLFTCAVSSKALVQPALLWMYRYDIGLFQSKDKL